MSNLTITIPTKQEAELVQLLQNRNEAALGKLYDMYHKTLFGVIQKIVAQEELAEDVLQEAFVKIWHNIDKYDAAKGRLYTWMHNITRNLAVDKLRSKDFRNNQKNQDLDNIVNTSSEPLTQSFNPDTIGIRNVLEKLKPEQKTLIEYTYFKGYTHIEIAEELSIPLGTVKTRLRAAMQLLRTLI